MTPHWSPSDAWEAGALMARSHADACHALKGVADANLLEHVGSETAILMFARCILDSPDAIASVRDEGSMRAVVSRLSDRLPLPQLAAVPGGDALCRCVRLIDDPQRRTFERNAAMARTNAIDLAIAAFHAEIDEKPYSGGGAAALLAALRELNGGRKHKQLRADALLLAGLPPQLHPADALKRICWGAYLIERDLFTIAEDIASRAAESTAGRPKAMVLNSRAAFMLDKYETFGDGSILQTSREWIRLAFECFASKETYHSCGRLARLSSDGVDLEMHEEMRRHLGLGDT